MAGCSDGTWKGVQYFSCQPERAFFCPLHCLKPVKDVKNRKPIRLKYIIIH